MTKLPLLPEHIPEFFKKNLSDKKNLFVFSTDIVKDSWIDWIITHPQKSGTDAVAFENFIAWDNFKSKFVSAHKEKYQAMPSLLRKMFVNDFILKNAEKPKNLRLQVIINSEDEFAKTAVSFSDWIVKNLPSLHFWKQRLEKSDYGELDAEDRDYLYLYEQYRNFLEENQLFEPGWIEDIKLSDSDFKFIIFYPELLEDFQDYAEIFNQSENITLCTFPDNVKKPEAYQYPDSRKELRHTILRMIQLAEEKKADYSEIALSVPDIDAYRPYLEREFAAYGVPFVIRAGVSLTKNSPGRIFQEINDCYANNFTFDSVRTLLLDECVPWKEEHKKLKENLIREGNAMRCICSPDNQDIWVKALSSKKGRISRSIESNNLSKEALEEAKKELAYYEELWNFYGKLKHYVSQFFEKGTTFESIGTAWQGFKSFFLESNENFDEFANLILGRCISELNEIIDVEKNFADCNLKISSPMEFFLQVLDSKKYTPQTKENGVSIFPYRLSAAAFFKYQFVIDASQKNLNIQYKRLTFLNGQKRSRLGLKVDDKAVRASEVFIKMYAKYIPEENGPDESFVHISMAEDSFSGFAIPHSSLNIQKELPEIEERDLVIAEKKYLLEAASKESENGSGKLKITESQLKSYENWSKKVSAVQAENAVNSKIASDIDFVLKENRGNPSEKDKIKVSARSDLENFFPCPRKWLYKSILRLHEDTLDTRLMQNYDMGNLNHKILELFMKEFEGKKLPYFEKFDGKFYIIPENREVINPNPVPYDADLLPLVEKAVNSIHELRDSPLVKDSLLKQGRKIADKIQGFLQSLLLPFGSNLDKNSGEPANFSGIGNCTLCGTEKVLEAGSDGFNFFGKIDTLLKSPENDWIIIDYKNSTAPSIEESKVDSDGRLQDFQMAMYVLLAKAGNQNEIAAGAFYKIKDGKAVPVVDKFLRTKAKDENGKEIFHEEVDEKGKTKKVYEYENSASYEKFLPTLETLREYGEDFTKAVQDLNFVPSTSKNPADRKNVSTWKNCAGCSFNSICRTTYTVGEKSI